MLYVLKNNHSNDQHSEQVYGVFNTIQDALNGAENQIALDFATAEENMLTNHTAGFEIWPTVHASGDTTAPIKPQQPILVGWNAEKSRAYLIKKEGKK